MNRIITIILILIIYSPLYGQCDGTPTDSTFDVLDCDTTDLNVLQDIIDLNQIDEYTSDIDLDNGDGLFAPIELGIQNWNDGRLSGLETNIGQTGLSYYYLAELPTSIGDLDSLIYLNISFNDLYYLPQSIGSLSNLQQFFVSGNRLTGFPDNFCQLSSLVWFDASFNPLDSLPSCFGNLSNLRWLDLPYCQLTIFPSSIGDLTNLGHLNLSANSIDEIPSNIGNLVNLHDLGLGGNLLQSLPSSISNLSNLWSLALAYNQFTTLPRSICDLQNLVYLRLRENELDSLPDCIGDLQNLYILSVDVNQLVYLPESIGNLDKLSYLVLENNLLTELPLSIGGMDSLFSLLLENNYLYCVGEFQDTSLIPNFLTDGTIPNVLGLHDQYCEPLSAIDLFFSNIFSISQNYPNPFNPVTTIQYELPNRLDVQITIYDLLGREVTTLVSETQEAGHKSVQWNATNVPSGMYFYQVRAGEFVQTRKMVLLK